MKILAIDDNKLALKLLTAAITEAQPLAEVSPFRKPTELLAYAKENPCDIAFLDIMMWGMNGLDVARKLKDLNPKINIIFVTAYSKYATEAFGLHPSGYIMKPVAKEAIEREIENLRYPIDEIGSARIYAQTFGNFQVFSYGVPLKFKYNKTKELLAYLIDHNGIAVDMNELCAVLWEEKQDSENLKSYLRNLISDLNKVLLKAGADDIILKQYNCISVIPDKIICDSYGYMKGDPKYINAYAGRYMAQYTWAKMTKWNKVKDDYVDIKGFRGNDH